jgi:hypothetical protein
VAEAVTNESINRRRFLAGLASVPLASFASSRASTPLSHDPRFTVLSLFHPQQILLHANANPFTVVFDNLPVPLGPLISTLLIERDGDKLTASGALVTALKLRSVEEFSLEVPGMLKRSYRGTLRIDVFNGSIRCVVGLDREIAVASIVVAESPPHASREALAAQASASRSFMLGAVTGHVGANFCDTTHCQYLAGAPSVASAWSVAARHTGGLVLRYQNEDITHTLAAMYSRSCGGRTRTLAELGLPARGYPYYAVNCAFCRAHPEIWQTELDEQIANTERGRLDYNRIHGWSALPGHIDRTTGLRIEGRGVGHGIGLCQLGAADMAARGATFAEILNHYYPNTTLAQAT